MKKCLFLFACLFLFGCSTNITKKQTELTISDLNAIEQRIEEIGNKIPQECKAIIETDLFDVKRDLGWVKKSVELINENCTSEKKVLEQKNTIQALWLLIEFAIISFLVYNLLKRK